MTNHLNIHALLNNCPMHCEFPSDAWLKINAKERKTFKNVKQKCIFKKNLRKLQFL